VECVVTERIGDVAVALLLDDQLDVGNAEAFRSELAPVLEECSKLVLNMSRVQFVDSRGCGAIIACLKRVSAAGGDLKLCHVNPPVQTVLELIRLHRICEICATQDDAVRSFQSGPA
jgi:anti-sigma B factor antagonist